MDQRHAKLRVCGSCEFIYRRPLKHCPMCGFASYGARFVYGDACYRYEKTQEPWRRRQHRELDDELDLIIDAPRKTQYKMKYHQDAVDWFKRTVVLDDVEQFGVVALDRDHSILGYKIVSIGEDWCVKVDPKTAFRFGLEKNARALCVLHNHPGGKLKPSTHDRNLARELAKLGRMLLMPVAVQILVVPSGEWLDYGTTYHR